MDLGELKRLVRGGESQTVEFKRKINHPEKVVREVVAFANSDGGHLLVGVDDNGNIPGLKFPDEEEFVMTKAIEELCRPKVEFSLERIQIKDGRSVLHYEIHSSPQKPHFAFLEKRHRFGKAFVRVEDRSVQASREIRQLLKQESKKSETSFEYGSHEKALLNYLGNHDRITLPEFCEVSKLDTKEASEVVIRLAMNHVIRIIPREQEDWYVFAELSN